MNSFSRWAFLLAGVLMLAWAIALAWDRNWWCIAPAVLGVGEVWISGLGFAFDVEC